MLTWPARRWTVDRHPQGFLAAPEGAYATRYDTGATYKKMGGGQTPYGWYLIPDPLAPQSLVIEARGGAPSSCVGVIYGNSFGNWAGNPSTIIEGTPYPSTGAVIAGMDRPWQGGYTTAIANNAWSGQPTVITGWPIQKSGGGYGIADVDPWDFWVDVLTTPRTNNAANATTLANVRMMVALLVQGTTLTASGSLGNSDALFTAFASSLSVNNGMYAAAIRFSTAAGDAGWTCATANDPGGVAAQTDTPLAAIAADTIYRLRMRFQFVAGVPTIFASVNDGTEVVITGNVGPATVSGGAGARNRFVPYINIRTLAAELKSLCFAQQSFQFGAGCEA